MISVDEYKQRVAHNTKLAKKYVKQYGNVGLLKMLDEVYAFDAEPGTLHITSLIKNAYDIIPAILLEYLPCVTNNGADAISLDDNEFVELEFKWSTIKSDMLWMTTIQKKVIFTGLASDRNRRATLRSALAGAFVVHSQECVDSKKRRTILLVSDCNIPEVSILDAFELDAETTHEYLCRTDSRTRNIKLSTFINHGKSVKKRSIIDDGIRYYNYETLLKNNLPTFDEWDSGTRYTATYKELLHSALKEINAIQKSAIIPTDNKCSGRT